MQRDGRFEPLLASPALPELQGAPGVLLYDIESDPDARHDFLHGFLRLPRDNSGQWDLAAARYHPMLVLAQHGEARCWQRLQGFLDRYCVETCSPATGRCRRGYECGTPSTGTIESRVSVCHPAGG